MDIEDMREATDEEYQAVNEYIDSISTLTGVNFWDDINTIK